jgi:calcineurin-like phosphoesterase family protein
MNEILISNWNKVVGLNDIVYHLGDFSFSHKRESHLNIFNRLNGKKHLIIGNHDSSITFGLGWESVQDYKELKIDGKHYILMHYPIDSWNRSYHGAIHFYGHVHTQKHGKSEHRPVSNKKGRYDVGVDLNNYSPIAISVAEKLALNND